MIVSVLITHYNILFFHHTYKSPLTPPPVMLSNYISPMIHPHGVVHGSEYVAVNLDDSLESQCPVGGVGDQAVEVPVPTLTSLFYNKSILFSNI